MVERVQAINTAKKTTLAKGRAVSKGKVAPKAAAAPRAAVAPKAAPARVANQRQAPVKSLAANRNRNTKNEERKTVAPAAKAAPAEKFDWRSIDLKANMAEIDQKFDKFCDSYTEIINSAMTAFGAKQVGFRTPNMYRT